MCSPKNLCIGPDKLIRMYAWVMCPRYCDKLGVWPSFHSLAIIVR
jgi:hypothetical protein